jgi:hypothetical protein
MDDGGALPLSSQSSLHAIPGAAPQFFDSAGSLDLPSSSKLVTYDDADFGALTQDFSMDVSFIGSQTARWREVAARAAEETEVGRRASELCDARRQPFRPRSL